MPRSRNIKPGLFHNEYLVELPFEVRLMFAGLPCFADREGRLEDRPKKIKMQMFPADNIEIEPMLDQLERYDFIQRYEVDNRKYIQIVNFSKHQSPHHKETESTIPAPTEHDASTGQAPDKPESNRPDSLNLVTDSFNDEPAAAPPSFWDVGKGLGIPGGVIGKWIKQTNEIKTAEAIAKIAIKRPADPIQYGTALLQDRPEKLFVPKDDDEMVRWAGVHFPNLKIGKTETYKELRERLWTLAKERNAA